MTKKRVKGVVRDDCCPLSRYKEKKKWCYTLLGTTMTRGEISDDDNNDVRVPELGVFSLCELFSP